MLQLTSNWTPYFYSKLYSCCKVPISILNWKMPLKLSWKKGTFTFLNVCAPIQYFHLSRVSLVRIPARYTKQINLKVCVWTERSCTGLLLNTNAPQCGKENVYIRVMVFYRYRNSKQLWDRYPHWLPPPDVVFLSIQWAEVSPQGQILQDMKQQPGKIQTETTQKKCHEDNLHEGQEEKYWRYWREESDYATILHVYF